MHRRGTGVILAGAIALTALVASPAFAQDQRKLLEDERRRLHTLRPTATAIGRSRAIRSKKSAGVSACGPSESASSGLV